jgi:hypothetical protein
MRRVAWALWSLLLVIPTAQSADSAKPDPWAPVRFLVGRWEGTTQGEPGAGTVVRTYEFALGNRFIHERNVSRYPPQEKNKQGEVHEHWSFLSHDRARKVLVLRQFHTEGFVNQYAHATTNAAAKQIVFESEAFENLPGGWRARETYDVLGPDEFTETFQLAEPGKDFHTYSTNRFKRVKESTAHTAPSPYAGEEQRQIKALSAKESDDLLAGNGMGYAKAAELNGYPGPAHVLELSDKLHLTPEQLVATKSIEASMRSEAKSLGVALVEAERKLDVLFASNRIDEQSLAAAVGEIGRLQAELRQSHLRAHLAQARLLDSAQTQRYFALRGYEQQHHH